MRKWFDRLLTDSPAYGYFPEPSNTVLVVQSSDLVRANGLLHCLGVRMVTASWFLGVFVGERSLTADFVSDKFKVWCKYIQRNHSHSKFVKDEPQASFVAERVSAV